jgi:hypothetical protein
MNIDDIVISEIHFGSIERVYEFLSIINPVPFVIYIMITQGLINQAYNEFERAIIKDYFYRRSDGLR